MLARLEEFGAPWRFGKAVLATLTLKPLGMSSFERRGAGQVVASEHFYSGYSRRSSWTRYAQSECNDRGV